MVVRRLVRVADVVAARSGSPGAAEDRSVYRTPDCVEKLLVRVYARDGPLPRPGRASEEELDSSLEGSPLIVWKHLLPTVGSPSLLQ